MNKTKIEYLDYTWSPLTGCKHGCSYCYARKIATRFAGSKAFPNGFEPTVHMTRILEPLRVKKPSRIGVCFMADLFGDWVDSADIRRVLATVNDCSQHTFIFLTKNPARLAEFNPWPDNAWVGATATDHPMYDIAITCLARLDARIRFISFEPLLSPISAYELGSYAGRNNVDWLILGAQTAPLQLPQRKWVDDVEQRAGRWSIPVFEKNNLASLFPERKLRQEYP